MSDEYDLAVIGLGSAGLTAVEFATALGLRTAAIEAHRVGGDCLWTGCVPSKAILASAKVAHSARRASTFGISVDAVHVDRAAVWDRVRRVQRTIAEGDDSPDRLRDRGATVVMGRATIVDGTTVVVDDRRLTARHIMVATGSQPRVPDIPGLADTPHVTSDTIWSRTDIPDSVAIIGGGPIAVEFAQALARLDVRVTVVQRSSRLLPRDEPELAESLTEVLRDEGVEVLTDAEATRVAPDGDGVVVYATVNSTTHELRADLLLVACGRRVDVGELGLDALGIGYSDRGVVVDEYGRTSVPTIWAAGDVVGGPQFTHAAGHSGAAVVRNAFFPGLSERPEHVPWCTFTDPELAHVGLTIADAEAKYGAKSVKVWRRSLRRSDRALADGATTGSVVVVVAKERVVGASVLSPAAGEVITEFTYAVREKLRFSDLAGIMHIYPTHATPVGQLAAQASFDRARRLRTFLRLVQR